MLNIIIIICEELSSQKPSLVSVSVKNDFKLSCLTVNTFEKNIYLRTVQDCRKKFNFRAHLPQTPTAAILYKFKQCHVLFTFSSPEPNVFLRRRSLRTIKHRALHSRPQSPTFFLAGEAFAR